MLKKMHKTKGIVHLILFLFILLVTTDAWPSKRFYTAENDGKPVVRVKRGDMNIPVHQAEKFEKLFTEGLRLFQEEFDYKGAIEKFTEALRYAAPREQKSDVYFYLSLAYYAMPEITEEQSYVDMIKKLIEVDYYRTLDVNTCPRGYLEKYQEIKREYGVLKVLSRPSGADVYVDKNRTSAGKTPLTIGLREGEVNIEVRKGIR